MTQRILNLVLAGLATTAFAKTTDTSGRVKRYVSGIARSPVGVVLGSSWSPNLEGQGMYHLAVQDAMAREHGTALSRAALDLLADLEEVYAIYATHHGTVAELLSDIHSVAVVHQVTMPSPLLETVLCPS